MDPITPTIEDVPVPPIVLNGRTFHPVTETTFGHDLHVVDIVEKSGIDKIAARFNPADLADVDDLAKQIIMTAYRSGALFKLLAAVLVEDGQEWDELDAEINAEFFASLRDKESKEALRNTLVATILSFFVNGLLSSATFQPSSTNGNSARARRTGAGTPPVADSTISASGTASSEISPDTTKGDIPSS